MTDRSISASNHYHSRITPAELGRIGKTASIDRTLNDVRDQLQIIFGPLGPVGTVHIAITVEPLTDSAGSPLMTREDSDHADAWIPSVPRTEG